MEEQLPETADSPVAAQNEPGVQTVGAERPAVAQYAPVGQ